MMTVEDRYNLYPTTWSNPAKAAWTLSEKAVSATAFLEATKSIFSTLNQKLITPQAKYVMALKWTNCIRRNLQLISRWSSTASTQKTKTVMVLGIQHYRSQSSRLLQERNRGQQACGIRCKVQPLKSSIKCPGESQSRSIVNWLHNPTSPQASPQPIHRLGTFSSTEKAC